MKREFASFLTLAGPQLLPPRSNYITYLPRLTDFVLQKSLLTRALTDPITLNMPVRAPNHNP